MSMLDLAKRAWAEISLDNITHNFKLIKKAANGAKVCAVVKANAYGHGIKRLAELYGELGADFFSVANIEEAIELRSYTDRPILILGYTPPECAYLLAKYDISQSIYSYEYAMKLQKALGSSGEKIKAHIKIDTGMGRLGFLYRGADSDALAQILSLWHTDSFIFEGIFTHLAVADGIDGARDYTHNQYALFVKLVSELESLGVSFEIKHIANSAAILEYPEFKLDMVRAGILLYGMMPSPHVKNTLGFKPALTLKSVISNVKPLRAGESVSYGRKFVAGSDMTVATVAIGYADGLYRASSGGVTVLVKGREARILGTVCMDQIIIDVTDIPDIALGDEVTVFDEAEGHTAADYAIKNNTISYEALCSLSRRLPRVYKAGGVIVDVSDYIIDWSKI